MSDHAWTFDAEVWEYPGSASWFFISLPEAVADEISDLVDGRPRAGFGSVKVHARIGTTRWDTSVFPDKARGTYMLPVKRAVRTKEDLVEGSRPTIELTVVGLD